MTARGERLVLDEMFPPVIAEQLRGRGHDVVALVTDPGLRASPDDEVYRWAGERRRRVVTGNVRDFRVLVAADPRPGVLFTSSRSFPRSRRDLGLLVTALDHWLVDTVTRPPPPEDWLLPPSSGRSRP